MAVEIVESEDNIKKKEETLIYLLLFSNTASKDIFTAELLLTIITSLNHCKRTRTGTISVPKITPLPNSLS